MQAHHAFIAILGEMKKSIAHEDVLIRILKFTER